jgi:non-ribosomal peptide synthetase-like protein
MWIEETWISFCRGAHVVVGTREECRDISNLGTLWQIRDISVVHAVPTLMSIMAMGGSYNAGVPDNVRLIVSSIFKLFVLEFTCPIDSYFFLCYFQNLGGEACPASLVNTLSHPGRRLINTYGPTETTVSATWAELTPNEPVTIGRPLPSYHALLLHEDISDRAAPIKLCPGSTGELAIGGPCVGLGYVNRAELTAKKFVEHPLHPGERLYRTGDLVSLDNAGCLRFLGRIDSQVKVRGFRIELGEIEECLNAQPGVLTSAVILNSLGPDDMNASLEGFVVLADGCPFNAASLQQGLTTLPNYMHPDKIFHLSKEDVPRLASGKVNTQGLRALSAERKRRDMSVGTSPTDSSTTLAASHSSPNHGQSMTSQTSLEILITSLHSVFPAEHSISPDADFFLDLGGHSLLAAMFVNRLRQSIPGVLNPFANVGLQDLYICRTARVLSERFPLDIVDQHDKRPVQHTTTPRWKYIACNVAQCPCLVFIWFLSSLELLLPYYIFYYLARDNLGWGIAAAYGMFVVIPFIITMVALVMKWVLLGRVSEGDHCLWGWFYLRWWFVEHLCHFVPNATISGTPLLAIWLRLLGAKIGRDVNVGDLNIGACADLVSIGDNTVIGADCILSVSFVEGGMLKLRRISIGEDAHIGAQCVLDGHARVEDAAELGSLSMVPRGCVIQTGEKWVGCPAQFDSLLPPLAPMKPPGHVRKYLLMLAYSFSTFWVLPLFYLTPQIPGLMLFDYVYVRTPVRNHNFIQTAYMAPVVGIAYVFLVMAELFFFRWAFLGKVRPGSHSTSSFFYFRKWFVDRLMDLSLTILRPVYATIYVPYFLRALGVTIGSRAEISTARSMTHDLVEIGEESFVADMVVVGDAEVRRGELILRRTKMGRRAFAGNSSVIPQGTVLAENTLVGVLSIAPPADRQLKPGETSFGSPPILLPVRQKFDKHGENLTFRPSIRRRIARGTVEAFRIFFPRITLIYGLGICVDVMTNLTHQWHLGFVPTLALLPAYYFVFFAMPALALTLVCKWLVIGVYRDAEWPMWDHRVWFSEAVTAIYESLAEPLLLAYLQGTGFLPICLRLFGAKIGRQVWLGTSDITEFDCVSIGDEAQMNEHSGPQTHLFEDRVMKVGRVGIGKRAVVGKHSIALPGSKIGDDTRLGSLSLVMSGETLPDCSEWQGSPVSLIRR